MPINDEVYRRLQRRIDALPVGFPETDSGVELRLLRFLFDENEAPIACEMSAVPETLKTIQRRLRTKGVNLAEEELLKHLLEMDRKGAIAVSTVQLKKGDIQRFSLMPLAVGMFECQVDNLTFEYASDFEQYLHGEFQKAALTTGTAQIRTVPIGKAINRDRKVALYDDINEYVRSIDGPFAVMNCVCRQAKDLFDDPCDHGDIRETCIMIGTNAVNFTRRGNARLIERKELLSILERAEKKGFVIQPENNQTPAYICCCCGDCCEILTTAKKLSRPNEVFHTNYFAEVDSQLCNGCGRCVKRCPMDAISLGEVDSEKISIIDGGRCIGCGLCVSTCPTRSMSLIRKFNEQKPAKSSLGMYARMYKDRRGLIGTAKVFARAIMKRQV